MSSRIKAYLMHWGENFARGWLPDGIDAEKALGLRTPAKRMRIDETVWRQLTDRLVSAACNTVVIDWFVKQVEQTGARPWCWSDRGWHHEDFISRCPKSVLLSDWYYDEHACGFDLNAEDEYTRRCLQLYLELDKAGFDQVPCGSNWNSEGRVAKGLQTNDSFLGLVEFCRRNIAPERLKGFLMTSWELWGTKGFPARTLAGIELSSQAYRDATR